MNQVYAYPIGVSMPRANASHAASMASTRTGSPASTSTESSGSDPYSSNSYTTPPSEGNDTSWSQKSPKSSPYYTRGVATPSYSHTSQDYTVHPAGAVVHGTIPLFVRVHADPTNLVATGREMGRAQTRLEQGRRAARRADHHAAMDRTKLAQQNLANSEASDDNNLLSGRVRFDQILKDRQEGRDAELRYMPDSSSSVQLELARAMDEAVQQLNGGRPSDEFELLDAIINHHTSPSPVRSRHDSSDSASSSSSQRTTRPPQPIATLQAPFQAFPYAIPSQRQHSR